MNTSALAIIVLIFWIPDDFYLCLIDNEIYFAKSSKKLFICPAYVDLVSASAGVVISSNERILSKFKSGAYQKAILHQTIDPVVANFVGLRDLQLVAMGRLRVRSPDYTFRVSDCSTYQA